MSLPAEAYGLLAILGGTLAVSITLIVWAYCMDRKNDVRTSRHDESDPRA